jgi:hypothetical protein
MRVILFSLLTFLAHLPTIYTKFNDATHLNNQRGASLVDDLTVNHGVKMLFNKQENTENSEPKNVDQPQKLRTYNSQQKLDPK